MDLDKIVNGSQKMYPEGSRKFEKQLKQLKAGVNGDEGYMCNVCKKVIKHKGTFNRHVQSHQKSFKCFLCDSKFNREDKLKKHERGHLSGYKNSENQYNCQHCREAFNNYTNLFDHVKIKHNS